MQLLIYRASHERLADELARREAVVPVIMEPDGTLAYADGSPADEAEPEAGWFSRDLVFDETGADRLYAKALLSTPSMKWVQSVAAGWEHPLFQRLLGAGIRLSINDASSIAIAEFVLAQVFAAFHPVAARAEAQAAHRWERLPFREMHGTRWVVLGYGSIGAHVGARAAALGAEVVGVRRTPRPDDAALRVVTPDALADEVAEADVLAICAAANDGNRHLIDAAMLARMKPDAVLVNIARGTIVDEAALVAALDAGRPGTAILDVFEEEPLPEDSPLWDHPKVRVTAHCSNETEGTGPRGEQVFLEHLDAYLAGAPLRLEVTPE
jgi:phosphoglycerate dehydrogenase-like enzyme